MRQESENTTTRVILQPIQSKRRGLAMNQAMQNQLKIMLMGPVAVVSGHVFAELIVQGLVARGLAKRGTAGGRPAVKITDRGRQVMKRLNVK